MVILDAKATLHAQASNQELLETGVVRIVAGNVLGKVRLLCPWTAGLTGI